MKTVKFKNKMNGDQFVCDDIVRNKQLIDGIEFLIVRRIDSERKFLIRKDALEPIKEKQIR